MSRNKHVKESTIELEHIITQLSKNYELLRRQTSQGFKIACVFMVLGFLVIVSGSVGELCGFVSERRDLAFVAGIVMEFISGTALLIYRSNFQRLNFISDKLLETLRILTAFRKTETLPENEKASVIVSLITALSARKQESIETIKYPITKDIT